MTGRERLHNILNRKPVDRLSWTTLVDGETMSVMPEPERSMMPLEFYRRIGCDVMQFGSYGLPGDCRVPLPARAVWPESDLARTEQSDGAVVVTNKTRWGTLVSASRNGHPIKPPVQTLDDLRVLRRLWEHMHYEEVPEHEERFRRAEALIGDRGMYLPTLDPSPVQQLIEMDMGAESFYYFLQDAPEEMEALLGVMHERRRQEYEIVARRTPAEAVIPVENTSSTLTSPAIYERYSLPQIRDYCDIMHRRGKKVVLHMCGLLRNLLPIVRRTGCDGYNATTPPTVGDTTFDAALHILGDDAVLFGGILNPGVFQKPAVTAKEMRAELDRLYTPRIRRANLLLWLAADGLATPLERFLWVAEWMGDNADLRSSRGAG
ncbi:MAG: uroporphyrinogen decarboxylase family protein [Candidatus Brocadiia bacterium]